MYHSIKRQEVRTLKLIQPYDITYIKLLLLVLVSPLFNNTIAMTRSVAANYTTAYHIIININLEILIKRYTYEIIPKMMQDPGVSVTFTLRLDLHIHTYKCACHIHIASRLTYPHIQVCLSHSHCA